MTLQGTMEAKTLSGDDVSFFTFSEHEHAIILPYLGENFFFRVTRGNPKERKV